MAGAIYRPTPVTLQRQTAVAAYFSSKQLLLFVFAPAMDKHTSPVGQLSIPHSQIGIRSKHTDYANPYDATCLITMPVYRQVSYYIFRPILIGQSRPNAKLLWFKLKIRDNIMTTFVSALWLLKHADNCFYYLYLPFREGNLHWKRTLQPLQR